MQYLTLKQICDKQKIPYNTLYYRVLHSDRIRTQRLGNMLLVHKDDVKYIIEYNKQKKILKTKSKIYSRWTTLLNLHREEVVPEWHNYDRFIQDMGLPKNPKMRLTRRDKSKMWSPENCVWRTR